MKMVSYMIPDEHVAEIERRCMQERVTQDEIVRRAVAEYLSKESLAPMSEVAPRNIRTTDRAGELV